MGVIFYSSLLKETKQSVELTRLQVNLLLVVGWPGKVRFFYNTLISSLVDELPQLSTSSTTNISYEARKHAKNKCSYKITKAAG